MPACLRTRLAPPISFTATFAIATAPVAANTTVTITAVYKGTMRTATVTVTPGTPITSSVSNGRDAIWSGACSTGLIREIRVW